MKKRIVTQTAVALLFLGVLNPSTSAAAQSISQIQSAPVRAVEQENDPETTAALEAIASDLEFFFSRAAVLNPDETIASINVKLLEEKYGESKDFTSLGEIYNQGERRAATHPGYSLATFRQCVSTGVAQAFGIELLKQAFNDEVVKALKSRAWKVASAIIFKNLETKIGKKGAQLVIKKIASKALPGGLPAQLALIGGKCGTKEAWNWWKS
ncbi:hypothetical protein KEM60_01106 [Austwickia sp. TVS 96-490-7B]|uniref:hypothetical protein n=1 Tax=Austwickia sp. TVS 96-490-7B TaxID=2830843 RepID=UPI001C566978|nr:hypothetical protein [Austwickia sp. TVS 96-490-7B]MBW3084916.1 hypothetical protein [Austwickia sp. TVS 96-490-7B]